MKDKEMAEEYADTLLAKDDAELDKFLDEYLGDLRLTKKQAGAILGIIKGVGIGSYLAGLETGRPKWHNLQKDPTDLPKEKCDVLDENGNTLHYDSGYFYKEYIFCTKEYPVAWCEIPQYTEE